MGARWAAPTVAHTLRHIDVCAIVSGQDRTVTAMPPVPSPAPCEDEPTDGDLLNRFFDETWRDWTWWEARLPLSGTYPGHPHYPLLRENSSVPPGWRRISLMGQGAQQSDFALCRHPRGFWIVVSRRRDYPQKTRVRWIEVTVDALYNDVRDDGLDPRQRHSLEGPVMDWLRDLLLAVYDPTNDTEAAAATIIALGGPATVTPHKLR